MRFLCNALSRANPCCGRSPTGRVAASPRCLSLAASSPLRRLASTNASAAASSKAKTPEWWGSLPDELDMIEATLNLARQLLASGEVQPYRKGENPFELAPYTWETAETPAEAQRRIFLGTVSELATGQGHTVWFAAGLARDENEFRRKLAAHIGHVLANGAEVSAGLGDFPLSRTFISPPLRQKLANFDAGRDAPPSFSYLSRWHENRS